MSEPDFIRDGQRTSPPWVIGITYQPIVPSLLWLCDLPGQENSPDTSHLIIIAARASFSYLKSQGFECK